MECYSMGRKVKSLVGNKYGNLTVIAQSEERGANGSPKWICECGCGKETIVERSNLIRGKVKSCGECKIYNTYSLSDSYGIGYTSKNKAFYFDLEDYDKISKYNWSINGSGYLINTSEEKTILMHRYIMNAPDNLLVDHINHNTLDNRKENLRLCTYTQNNINKKINGYTIRKTKNSLKYEVTIRINGKQNYIGRFDTADEAIENRKKYYDTDHKNFEYNKYERMISNEI